MQLPTKILVAVDFSEPSKAALDYAMLLGDSLGADLDVLHVWNSPAPPASSDELLTRFAQSAPGHKMVEWMVACSEHAHAEPHCRLAAARPADVPAAILNVVESGLYDLVVLGAHAHRPWSHLLRAGVSQAVRRGAHCPVITVPAGEAAPSDHRAPEPSQDVPAVSVPDGRLH